MASYIYKGLDAKGKLVGGSLAAESQGLAADQLQRQGVTPTLIEQQLEPKRSGGGKQGAMGHSWSGVFTYGNPLRPKQVILITRQLATLMNAHLPIDESIQLLINQENNKRVLKVLLTVQQQILDGKSLASALNIASHSFSAAYTATIFAGERSGQLGPVLQKLADYSQVMQQTKSRIQIALIYPAIMVLVSLAVISLLVVYVVPQVAEVIVSMNQELPTITRGLIAFSGFLSQYYGLILLALLTGLLLFSAAMKQPSFRMQVHKGVVFVPGLKRMIKTYLAARFCKTLAMLYDGGTPIVEAIETAGAVVGNDYVRKHILAASRAVQEGKGFLSAFNGRPVLPSLALHLIASGQENGQLAQMLDNAASDLEQQLQNTIAALLALIEPLMMVVMGGIVLLIVMAVMVPILDMNQLIM